MKKICLAVFLLMSATVLAQEPQSEFLPVTELPASEQLPSAPLVIAAYAFVWAAFLFLCMDDVAEARQGRAGAQRAFLADVKAASDAQCGAGIGAARLRKAHEFREHDVGALHLHPRRPVRRDRDWVDSGFACGAGRVRDGIEETQQKTNRRLGDQEAFLKDSPNLLNLL